MQCLSKTNVVFTEIEKKRPKTCAIHVEAQKTTQISKLFWALQPINPDIK